MLARTVKSMGARDWVILILLSFSLSVCGVYGFSFGMSDSGGSPTIPDLLAVVLSCVLILPVGFIFLLVNAGLTKLSYASLNRDAQRVSVQEALREGEGADQAEAISGDAAAECASEAGAGLAASAPKESRLARFVPKMTVKSVALFAAIMIVLWSPYLVAAFPGSLYNDTAVQMQQVYEAAHPLDIRSGGNVPLSQEEVAEEHGNLAEDIDRAKSYRATDAWLVDHHPFALTLLFGGLALASDALFGNWMPAVGLLMVVQVLVMAGELSFCAAYLRRKGAPLGLCLAAYLFFCLLPLVPLDAALVMKDTIFSLFFVPWFLMLVEGVLTKGAFYERKGNVAALVALAVLLCLTKKTGVYVVGATALFGLVAGLIAWRREAGRAASAEGGAAACRSSRALALANLWQGGVCALLMFALLPALVFPALNIVAGSKGEMLGLLFQQTARVYRDAGADALTPEERQAIQGVLRVSGLEWDYVPTYTDKVKARYYLESTDEELLDYLGAYVSMGQRFPGSYLASVVSVASGFMAPVRQQLGVADTLGWQLLFDGNRTVLWPLEQTEPLRVAINRFFEQWASIPVLNVPLSGVTYCLWIPALAWFFCLRNRLRSGIWFVPLFVVTAFCLIGPIYQIRYLMPEILLAPVIVGAAVVQAKAVFKERADAARLQREAHREEGAQPPLEQAPQEAVS